MFKRLKEQRATSAREQAAKKRMHAEHAAGILRSLTHRPDAPVDDRLRSLMESAIGKLTDENFAFDDARDALYAAAGYIKGVGNEWWSAAARDAVIVLSKGFDPEGRDYYKPGGLHDRMQGSFENLPRPQLPQAQQQPTATPRPAPQAPKRPLRRSCIYVITAEGSPIVKIGKADDPEQRVKRLQTGSPAKLTVAWTVQAKPELELLLHERFADYRESGEWFDLTELGDAVTVVREEADRIRKEFTDKGQAARYFYED